MPARLLIIEDNPTNLELVVYLLTRFGHEVDFSDNGLDGLRKACEDRFDLILCDIELPDISGFDIVARLKADVTVRHIPMIAVTALAMVGDRSRIIEAGFDGYIPKPIEPQGLLDDLDRFLRPEQRGVRQPQPTASRAATV